ncbi:efflux RND transporter periplasmic adaptor subunit [Clostridium oceanicum]|uniref:Efflux RND transporter periplasmic adaptor subunit n=1 Tax=Clostridium oceanicum TaxID=1543 RepID=A0ABN1JIF9_9CLOT
MRKHFKKLIALGVVVLVIISSIFILNYSKGKNEKENIKNINVTAEKQNIVSKVQANGVIFSANTKEIVANNNGEIKDLKLNEGDTVKKGQAICSVYSEQIIQQVDNASLNLERQRLEEESSKSNTSEELQNLLIEDAEKKLQYAQSDKANMLVTSPINGLIVQKQKESGDKIQSEQTILEVSDISALKAKVSVDELDIAKIKKGQKVKINSSSIQNKSYEGEVESISPKGVTENNVTTYDVVIKLNDIKDLKLGMTINSEIIVESKNNVLSVPSEAIVEKDGKKYVTVEDENSPKGKVKEVKCGIENEESVEILEGIKEGENIIVHLPNAKQNSDKDMKNIMGKGKQNPMPSGGGPSNSGRMKK